MFHPHFTVSLRALVARSFRMPTIGGRAEGVDALRGLFALEVLVFAHAISWASVSKGESHVPTLLRWAARGLVLLFQQHGELNPAVLGFIVLSGYCIHRNGLRVGMGTRAFVIRRVFRILPVFLLANLLGVILFQQALPHAPEMLPQLSGTHGITMGCLAAKISMLAALVPLAHGCDFLGNAPLLTVMVEIALYAFYLLAFRLPGKPLLPLAACAVSLAAGVVIAALNHRFPVLYNWWQNSSVLAFLPYWWVGALAVDATCRAWLAQWAKKLLLVWLLLTVASYFEHTAILAELRKLVLACLLARLVVLADSYPLRTNPLSALGQAGYSIYALHAPLVMALLVYGYPGWVSVLCALAMGVGSYCVFERPLNRLGHRLARN